jgi:hypothetical protein
MAGVSKELLPDLLSSQMLFEIWTLFREISDSCSIEVF